ncbi:MAG: hypothetical protein JW849_03950 [Phycisphaerae bacterium]|nr:hypothetical protein [Phycisphaerae bacterium]
MRTWRTTAALLLILTAGVVCLGGCKKKIDVTFTNLTGDRLDVYLSGPGEGTGVVGTLNGKNDRVHAQIKIPGDQLPAQYSWSAGEKYEGRFTIQKLRKIPPRFIDVGTPDAKTDTKPAK